MKKKYLVVKETEIKQKQDPHQKILYFAYGSNMDINQLIQRVGHIVRKGTFKFPNYRLSFDCGYPVSFANMCPEEGGFVEGVIYEMEYHQLRILDRYESLYNREKLELEIEPFKGRKLHYYISKFRNVKDFECPIFYNYYLTLLRGAIRNNLSHTIKILREIDIRDIVRVERYSI